MNTYPFMYLGMVIDNNDPEFRGRIQVFIPHIMPTLYEGWNKEGKDITINCVGDNMPQGLTSEIVDKLKKILPWAEAASPIVGQSSPGGVFPAIAAAVTAVGEAVAGAVTATGEAVAGALTFDQSPTTIPAGNLPPGSELLIPTTPGNSVNRVGMVPQFVQRVNGFYQEATSLGYKITLNSAFRTRQKQTDLYNENVRLNPPSGNGGVAPPGGSTHETGIAIDILTNGNGVSINTISTSKDKSSNRDTPAYRALLQKYGLHQPLHPDNARSVFEKWHIEPIETPTGASGRRSTPLLMSIADKLRGSAPSASELPSASQFPPNASPLTTKSPSNTDLSPPQAVATTNVLMDPPIPAATPTPASIPTTPASTPTAPTTPTNITIGNEMSGTVSGGGTVSSGLNIAPADAKPVGNPQTRTVSCYGSVYTDWTTFLDVKPDQRPVDALQYWQGRGYSVAKGEQQLRNGGSIPGTLNLADTWKGRFVGNLIGGFDVGVPKNGAYGLAGKSIIFVTDQQGKPIGRNGGYFRIGDTGSAKALTTQSAFGAIDFYAGKDTTLKADFMKLNGKATQIKVQPVDITGPSAESLKNFITQNGSDAAVAAAVVTSPLTNEPISVLDAPATVGNTDPHGPTVVKNTNDSAKGMFTFPGVGAMVWVFFREGNPLFPVYFAASYSSSEWKSAYGGNSVNPDGTNQGSIGSQVSNSLKLNPNAGGGLEFTHVKNVNDPTGSSDTAVAMIYGDDGSNMMFSKGYHQIYTRNDRRDQIDGHIYSIIGGAEEKWIEDDSSLNVKGNVTIKIGKIDAESMNAMKELSDFSKQMNDTLMSNAGTPPPPEAAAPPAPPTDAGAAQSGIDDLKADKFANSTVPPEPEKPWAANKSVGEGTGPTIQNAANLKTATASGGGTQRLTTDTPEKIAQRQQYNSPEGQQQRAEKRAQMREEYKASKG